MTDHADRARRAREFVANSLLPIWKREPLLAVGQADYAHLVCQPGRTPASCEELLTAIQAELQGPISLYAHMPVCRRRCPFCHYPVVASRRSDAPFPWVEALLRENQIVREQILEGERPQVSSLYLGGGTPTLMVLSDIERLRDSLGGAFSLDGAEITIEGTPESYLPETVAGLRGLVTRPSVGIQTLDDDTLRRIGRDHTGSQALGTLDRLLEAGFGQVNGDLIYGLPGQTVEVFLGDVAAVAARGVTSMTIYRLRLGREGELPTALSAEARRGRLTLPDPAETYAMQHAATELLEELGFVQRPSGWFTRASAPAAVYEDRWVRQRLLLALGWHTYSYGRGFESRNHPARADYLKAIREGRLPMQGGWVYGPDEERLRWVLLRLKSVFAVSRADFTERFGGVPEDEPRLAGFLARIHELGLSIGPDSELTPAGRILVEEIIGGSLL